MSLAHSMTPGYTQTYIPQMTYKVTNEYGFPATYRVDVYDKQFKPIGGWSVDKNTIRILPPNTKTLNLRFKSAGKYHVCTTLIGKGYDEIKPHTASRVCSRLWIK